MHACFLVERRHAQINFLLHLNSINTLVVDEFFESELSSRRICQLFSRHNLATCKFTEAFLAEPKANLNCWFLQHAVFLLHLVRLLHSCINREVLAVNDNFAVEIINLFLLLLSHLFHHVVT